MFGSLFGDDNEKPRILYLRDGKGAFVQQKISPLAFRGKLEAIAYSYGRRTTNINMVKDYAALIEDPRSLEAVKSSPYMRDSLLQFMGAVVEEEQSSLQASGGNASRLEEFTEAKKLFDKTRARLSATNVNFNLKGNLLTVECDGKAVGSLRVDPRRLDLQNANISLNGEVIRQALDSSPERDFSKANRTKQNIGNESVRDHSR